MSDSITKWSAGNGFLGALAESLKLAQGRNGVAVTPNDSTDITVAGETDFCLYVGTGGTLKVNLMGTTVTFVNVPDGSFLPVRVTRVWNTGSTATNILAIY